MITRSVNGLVERKTMTATNKPEEIGFHKGALTTLAKERQELSRILEIVEQLMQMHIKALKDLGVDLEAEAKKAADQTAKAEKTKSKSLEEELL